MTKGPFHDMFTGPDLQMREAISNQHPDPCWQHTASYQKGDTLRKWPIDGVYVTPNLPIYASTRLHFMPHLGDHRFAVLDVNSKALVGDNLLEVIRPQARRQSGNIPQVFSKYTHRLLAYMLQHKVLSKLHYLYSTRARWQFHARGMPAT
jgi:hypothetical protein